VTYTEFLARIVVEGVEGLERVAAVDDASPSTAGAVAAYDACVECDSPPELGILLAFARNKHIDLIMAPVPNAYECLFAQGFADTVAWVCNCVSALLLNEGYPALIPPTSRGIMKCSELLGAAPRGVPLEPQWFTDSPAAGTPDCLCSFCGRPIEITPMIVLRAYDAPRRLELRACERDACTQAFLNTPMLTQSGITAPS
jgi:hypothetical protein